MSERYIKLFTLPENQYASGAPVILAAGALLKDNQTGKVLAQLKFKSISPAIIKALKVKILAFDVEGNELETVEEFSYLDLHISRNDEFGQKTPIQLHSSITRSMSVECTTVVFENGSIWNNSDEPWESLPQCVSLYSHFDKVWLAEQYCRDVGPQAEYVPMEYKDLWYCTCGIYNHSAESRCTACGAEKSLVFGALNIEVLKSHNATYEAKKAVQDEAHRVEEEKRNKRNKKNAIIFSITATVCVALILAWNMLISPSIAYRNAIDLMEDGRYEEAIAAFESLDGYKDSDEKIRQCEISFKENAYIVATAFMENGQFEEAITWFEFLDQYKDSTQQIEQCKIGIKDREYDAAIALMESGEKTKAIAAFKALGDYKDSLTQITKILFDGNWTWINPFRVNPYDTFTIDVDSKTITYHFKSPSKASDEVYSFEVVSSEKIYAKGLRESGAVTISYCEDGLLKLEYDHFDDSPSKNYEDLFLVRK